MTKVLFWNIEQFKADRINSSSNKLVPGAGNLTEQEAANQRRSLIYDTLAATNPDIIIIIEVLARQDKSSSTALDKGGLAGAVFLLSQLREGTAPDSVKSSEWRMVPPLWLKKETIAVLYRGKTGTRKRYFTGPNVWTGGPKGRTLLPEIDTNKGPYGKVTKQGYGEIDFNAMLVPPNTCPRTIPAGAQHNGAGDVFENIVAGRTELRLDQNGAPGQEAQFDSTATTPFLATFTETDDNGAILRDITIFAVHLPINENAKVNFIDMLSRTYEILSPPGTRETRLVGGDFNIPLLDPSGRQTDVYKPLTDKGYELLLTASGEPPPGVDAYRGYFATHVIKGPVEDPGKWCESKLLWSTETDPAYYPGYQYIGSQQSASSLDNILVKPKQQAESHDYKTTIMNLVVGTPFNKVDSPPGNPPTGTVSMDAAIGDPPCQWRPWPKAPTAPVYSEPAARDLFSWRNYGKIYGTSDHFAFYADV